MKDSVMDRISQKPVDKHEDDLLMKHDIKIHELDTRLRSLEQLCNDMHNQIPVYWEIIEDDETKA